MLYQLFTLLLIASASHSAAQYDYSTLYFEVPLDHFNFNKSNDKFEMRYLINTQYWDGKGPILFYTGNEGPIDLFANNTGFMWDIAPQLNALLL